VGRDICVQTTDSVAFYLQAPGYKSQPSPQAKAIISMKSFFVYITTPLQSLANSAALMRKGSQETQARTKVGRDGLGEGQGEQSQVRMQEASPGKIINMTFGLQRHHVSLCSHDSFREISSLQCH